MLSYLPFRLLVFVQLIISSLSLSSSVYGMLTGTTIPYSSSSQITSTFTYLTITYTTPFKNLPSTLFTFNNYVDSSSSVKITFYIDQFAPLSKTVSTIRFTYSSDPSNVYNVAFRLRYLLWDKLIFPTIQSIIFPYYVPHGASNQVQSILFPSPISVLPLIYPFLNGIQNSASDTISNLILYQAIITGSNSTHFQCNIDINARNFNTAITKRILIAFLLLHSTTKYTTLSNNLMSASQVEVCQTFLTYTPNEHYLIGLIMLQKQQKSWRVQLKDNDTCINTQWSYDALHYTYVIFTLQGDTSGIFEEKVESSTLENLVMVYYGSVDTPGNKSVNNFEVSNLPFLTKKDFEALGADKMKLVLEYQKEFDTSEEIQIIYKWDHGVEVSVSGKVRVHQVAEIVIDLQSDTMWMKVVGVNNSNQVTSSDYGIAGMGVKNSFLEDQGVIFINVTLPTQLQDQYRLKIETADAKLFTNITMIKIDEIETIIQTNKIKIKLSNVLNLSTSSFTLDPPLPLFVQLPTLQLPISPHILSNLSISYHSPLTNHLFSLINIRTYLIQTISIKSTTFNQFSILFKNPTNKTITKGDINSLQSAIDIENVGPDVDWNLQVNCSYKESVQGKDVSFEYLSNGRYKHVVTVNAVADVPLLYWSQSQMSMHDTKLLLLSLLQYLYLSIFLISLICMKMAGIQTMYLIQLVYYSMIPIGIYESTSFMSFTGMKYVSGWNPLFASLSSAEIPYNYSLMGFQPSFLSNVNLMIFLPLLFPILSLILYVLSRRSTNYKLQPRFLKYSRSFLFDLPLSFFLFSSFNITISFLINNQYTPISSHIPTFTICLLSFSVLLLVILLSTIFQKHFNEFNCEINDLSVSWKMTLGRSVKIRKLYPFIMGMQMMIVAVFIGTQELFGVGLYVALGVAGAVTGYIVMIAPYVHQIDNWRLIITRCSILIVLLLQIYTKVSLANSPLPSTFSNLYVWLFAVILLVVGLINGSYIIYRTYLWFKKPGIINMKMYVEQKGTMYKVKGIDYVPTPKDNKAQSFPKLEYGVGFLNKRTRDVGEKRREDSREKNRLLREIKEEMSGGMNGNNNKLLNQEIQ